MSLPTKEEALAELNAIQKEQREYVKNVGIEYRFGCYEEKRADSCHLLGEFTEAIEQNFKAALNLFRDNCVQRDYPKSCYKYAMYLLHGKEVEPSFARMVRPLEVACKGDLPPACRYLGLVHWNGDENKTPPNSGKAEEAMLKACELEDPEACWLLSTWYLGPEAKFAKHKMESKHKKPLGQLQRDVEKALAYGIRACDLNVPQACANVSRMYRVGDGIPKNPDKSKEYIEKATAIVDLLRSREATPDFTGS
uniref:Cytochrome c oxidase assembly factor 7 n=1 Tax=Panagrellus redivivus TaxID=6233 RepID=A0A7E4WD64_PANRE